MADKMLDYVIVCSRQQYMNCVYMMRSIAEQMTSTMCALYADPNGIRQSEWARSRATSFGDAVATISTPPVGAALPYVDVLKMSMEVDKLPQHLLDKLDGRPSYKATLHRRCCDAVVGGAPLKYPHNFWLKVAYVCEDMVEDVKAPDLEFEVLLNLAENSWLGWEELTYLVKMDYDTAVKLSDDSPKIKVNVNTLRARTGKDDAIGKQATDVLIEDHNDDIERLRANTLTLRNVFGGMEPSSSYPGHWRVCGFHRASPETPAESAGLGDPCFVVELMRDMGHQAWATASGHKAQVWVTTSAQKCAGQRLDDIMEGDEVTVMQHVRHKQDRQAVVKTNKKRRGGDGSSSTDAH